MAIVGHWSSLAEAQKLTQSELLKGIVQEVIESGNLLPMMPVKQLNAKSLLYNREVSWTASTGAAFVDTHEALTWQADQTYSQIEVALKQIARQDVIDRFIAATYGNINDYKSVMITEVAKKVSRFTEHMLRYGDVTYGGAKQFDGLHAMAQENTGDLDYDNGETVLSIMQVRKLLDAIKIDQKGQQNVILLMPREIARRFDAAYQESGLVRSQVTHSMATITIGGREIMERIPMIAGVPVIRDDFLVAEQANTGVGSDARALRTSGTNMYSIFAVRLGPIEEGELELLFGDPGAGEGIFSGFTHESFEKLEDYIAGGERIYGFLAPALGASISLGRIYDITDGELVP